MQTAKPAINKFGLPYLGNGLGLRAQHYDHIINNKPKIDWFEIISENYMNSRGRAREKLDEIRSHYPIVMHGVSLSIGSTDGLNLAYLKKLKQLAEEVKPVWISDHLCWTGINSKNTHDLLPMPLTAQSLAHLIPRIKQVQDILGRPLLLENPSSYLTYKADHIPEYEFIAELAEKADCALLLDVNNIYVASYNQRISPQKYINSIPQERVVQIHLAGHTNLGTHIVDTHDSPVNDDVWGLYNYALERLGNISTMIEWDGNIPEFPVLEAELAKTKLKKESAQIKNYAPAPLSFSNHSLHDLQSNLQTAIHSASTENAALWINAKENFPPEEQLKVYINAYRIRLAENILEDYPETAAKLGEKIKPLIIEYINTIHSTHTDLAAYCWSFADFMNDETADIERKLAKCFDLPQSPAAKPEDFTGISEDEFLRLRIFPRKASFLTKTLAIYRKEDSVHKLELEENEFNFLQQLNSGKNIGEALDAMHEILPKHLERWFAKWLENEFISLERK